MSSQARSSSSDKTKPVDYTAAFQISNRFFENLNDSQELRPHLTAVLERVSSLSKSHELDANSIRLNDEVLVTGEVKRDFQPGGGTILVCLKFEPFIVPLNGPALSSVVYEDLLNYYEDVMCGLRQEVRDAVTGLSAGELHTFSFISSSVDLKQHTSSL